MATEKSNAEKIKDALDIVKNKESKIYFLTQDTHGHPRASVAYTYELVKLLVNEGYNAIILHEKNDYKIKSDDQGMGLEEWLGTEYSTLPHASVEGGGLAVGPADFLIVPEVFGHVMEQTKDMACTKIVLCQSYDYIFEMLQPGINWANYGYHKAITTSNASKEYINSIFPNIEVSVIPPSISDKFEPSNIPSQPIIAIHTREPRDTMKIVKGFYARFPQFKWITFRDMRGMSVIQFSEALEEVCLGVWIDDISGFGTFPLECMKSGIPVVGKIPNLKPDWLEEENGFWTFEYNQIIDIINAYIKTWLEDGVPEVLYEKMKSTVAVYDENTQQKTLEEVITTLFHSTSTQLEDAFNKFEEADSEITDKFTAKQEN